MSAPPPDKLDYESIGMPPPIRPGFQVLIGLLVGACASIIVWVLGWDAVTKSQIALIVAVVAIASLKIAGGSVLLFVRRWRFLGAGLLISLALGFLIFFGNCFAHM